MRNIDILCIGEVLVDFIGHQTGVNINETRDYHRYLGGSPTNVAMNSARLGLKSVLVAAVGNDAFGEYVFKRLEEVGVDTKYIKTVEGKPTSVIFVSRTESTPDFIPFREADYRITQNQVNKHVLEDTTIFHTTCFALSKDPAQTTILRKAEEAYNLGCTLSIDVNYAKKLWDSQAKALEVIKAYCKFDPLVKISEDDMLRLFEEELSHDEIFNFFHFLTKFIFGNGFHYIPSRTPFWELKQTKRFFVGGVKIMVINFDILFPFIHVVFFLKFIHWKMFFKFIFIH